jgi:hypothetical protein
MQERVVLILHSQSMTYPVEDYTPIGPLKPPCLRDAAWRLVISTPSSTQLCRRLTPVTSLAASSAPGSTLCHPWTDECHRRDSGGWCCPSTTCMPLSINTTYGWCPLNHYVNHIIRSGTPFYRLSGWDEVIN